MSCCVCSSVLAKTVRCCSGCGSACPKLALRACRLSARLSHIRGFVFRTKLFRVLIFSCCSVWSLFSTGGCSLFVKLAKVHIPMSKLMRSRRLLPSLLLRRCFHGQRASAIHLQQQQKISSAAATRGRIDDAQQQDVGRLWSRATFSRSKFASGYTALTPKSLDSIMKIDTVRYTSPQEIIAIWNDVRKTRPFSFIPLLLLLYIGPCQTRVDRQFFKDNHLSSLIEQGMHELITILCNPAPKIVFWIRIQRVCRSIPDLFLSLSSFLWPWK